MSGWWFGTFGLFFHILGISSSQLTKSIIFQRGRLNQQPDVIFFTSDSKIRKMMNYLWKFRRPWDVIGSRWVAKFMHLKETFQRADVRSGSFGSVSLWNFGSRNGGDPKHGNVLRIAIIKGSRVVNIMKTHSHWVLGLKTLKANHLFATSLVHNIE